MTTPLLLLRCAELGINIRDLDLLTVGMVEDIFQEKVRDEKKFPLLANQEDFDRF